MIAQASNTPYIDDIILSKFESDTVFIFRPNAVIRNDGFFVETVIPPHWVQDNTESKLYRIDLGTHYGRLFHRKDHDYEVLDSAFYRITTSGDAIYVHMGNRKVEAISPYRVEIKYLGIIPIPSFITRPLLD